MPDDLSQLVRSLTPSEKRYYTLNAGLQKGDKKYLTLFRALSQYKGEKVEHVYRKFSQTITPNQFNFLKNYLFNSLLDILLVVQDKSQRRDARERIQKSRYLIKKGLVRAGKKQLLKSKQSSYECEDFTATLEALHLEKEVARIEMEYSRLEDSLLLLYHEERQILKCLGDYIESENLFQKVQQLYMQFGNPRNDKELTKYLKLFEHPLFLQMENGQELPSKVKINLLLSQTIIHLCLYNQKPALEYSIELLKILKEHPVLQEESTEKFLLAYMYYLKCTAFLVARDRYLLGIKQLEQSRIRALRLDKNVLTDARYFYTITYSRFFYLLQNCLLDEAYHHLPSIKKEYSQAKIHLNDRQNIYLSYSISLVYFGNEKYETSLEWFNDIMNHYHKDTTPHIYLRIRLMLLIIHYELGNHQLLEHMVVATYRYLLKKRRMYQYESAVIRFIRQLSALRSVTKLHDHFMTLLTDLLEIVKDPFELAGCAWFIYWLESKKKSVNLKEIFHSRSANISNSNQRH